MAALVAVSLIGTLAPVSPAAAVDGPDWAAATTCTSPVRPVVTLRPAGFTVYDPAYRYSYDQSVLTRALWTTPPTTDTVRNLEVYGFLWIPSLLEAMRSAPDADDRLAGLVSSVASTLVWRPDNRAVTDPVWNEGTNLRRQENLNCLYAVARDDRLLPLIQAVAHANLDPNRYYGPPQRPPHNHGLMANLALLNAGALLGRSDWRTAALGRMRTAIAASFTAVGLSIEQSSSYHQSVLSKWVGVSRRLRQLGGDDEIALATAVDSVLVRARRALGYLLMPNAVPVEFGDQSGLRTDLVAQSRLWFQDDAAGVLTARWSWSSPTDAVAARYGGQRAMHGHEDRMSVVWWATGRPVLVDPGTSTYVAGAARDWTTGPLAHNVPVVTGRSFVRSAPIALSSVRTGAVDSFVLSGRPWGVTQSRRVAVDPRAHLLTLTDTATSRLSPVLQLDSRWSARTITRPATS